jgi:glycerol-3-phosphate acyltransferase PlsY
MVESIIPIIIGYLLGSFLPAYFLLKFIKRVDIRSLGDKNPGTTNVKRNFGYPLAVLVAIYDVSKGLIAMLIAYQAFRAPTYVVMLAGFATIIGHKFPFYLGFKGGRGIAATVGIFLFLFVKVIVDFFTPFEIIISLIFLAVEFMLIRISTHDDDFFAVTFLPIIGLILAIRVKTVSELLLVLFLMGMIVYESSKNLKMKMFTIKSERVTIWRVFARPLALLFILFYNVFSKRTAAIIAGVVLIIFFVFDVIRLFLPKVEARLQREVLPGFQIIRKREKGHISSITNFMLGLFLTLIIIKKELFLATLGFTAVGDMFSKIVGINYGKTAIFGGKKTLEGTIGFLVSALAVAFALYIAGVLPLWIGIVGAVIASATEVLPSQIDDNISIPIVSGTALEILYRTFI